MSYNDKKLKGKRPHKKSSSQYKSVSEKETMWELNSVSGHWAGTGKGALPVLINGDEEEPYVLANTLHELDQWAKEGGWKDVWDMGNQLGVDPHSMLGRPFDIVHNRVFIEAKQDITHYAKDPDATEWIRIGSSPHQGYEFFLHPPWKKE